MKDQVRDFLNELPGAQVTTNDHLVMASFRRPVAADALHLVWIPDHGGQLTVDVENDLGLVSRVIHCQRTVTLEDLRSVLANNAAVAAFTKVPPALPEALSPQAE